MSNNPREQFIDVSLWHGNLDESKAILAAHPEVAASDIYTAAILGDDAAVRRFLEADAGSATAKGAPRNWDALTYLCFSKYLRLDPARSEGFVRAATALLDAGADANTGFFDETHQPTPERESVLYGAAGVAHHPEMTRLLLERGADPNDAEVPYHSPETLDNRALKILVESGKLTPASIGMMLLRKFNWQDDNGVAWLLDHGADPNLSTGRGGRPLHHALGNSVPLSYFELLLDHGADPTLTNCDGVTPFAIAARMARADVLDLFEKRGFQMAPEGDDAFLAFVARGDEAAARRMAAEDPALAGRLQSQNSGLLVDFAGSGNVASVRLLLDLGFDIGAARSQPRWRVGETALHAAAGRGLLPMARLLMERGAPLEARHQSGMTPLDAAIRCITEQSEWTPNRYTVPIAKLLLDAGAELHPAALTLASALCLGRAADVERLAPGAGPRDWQMALAAAAFNGNIEAMRAAIAQGADVNCSDPGLEHGAPLHNAVSSGSLEAVKLLVEAGARVDIADNAWRATPLDWAEHYQHTEIAAYLRAQKTD